MNIISAFHAYRFTHFTAPEPGIERTRKPATLSFLQKFRVLVEGIDNPRPENDRSPVQNFQNVIISGHDGKLRCWLIPEKHAKGTVILFHGYGACKSNMLPVAEEFNALGYQTFLVDFEGCGSSDGNRTTVGYYEAEEVKAAFCYCRKNLDSPVILFGSSMGASAIICAVGDLDVNPAAIILECPYGSLADTACNRFSLMGVPSFPFARLLVFWGGIENGYNAFDQNCIESAKNIHVPMLLMRGAHDKYVTEKEVRGIFYNAKGPKSFHEFAGAGHESYCTRYEREWRQTLVKFLANTDL